MYFNQIHIYLRLPNNINKYCRGQHNQSTNKNLNTDSKQEKLMHFIAGNKCLNVYVTRNDTKCQN